MQPPPPKKKKKLKKTTQLIGSERVDVDTYVTDTERKEVMFTAE